MKPVLLPDNIADAIMRLRQEGFKGVTPLHWDAGEMKVLDIQKTEHVRA